MATLLSQIFLTASLLAFCLCDSGDKGLRHTITTSSYQIPGFQHQRHSPGDADTNQKFVSGASIFLPGAAFYGSEYLALQQPQSRSVQVSGSTVLIEGRKDQKTGHLPLASGPTCSKLRSNRPLKAAKDQLHVSYPPHQESLNPKSSVYEGPQSFVITYVLRQPHKDQYNGRIASNPPSGRKIPLAVPGQPKKGSEGVPHPAAAIPTHKDKYTEYFERGGTWDDLIQELNANMKFDASKPKNHLEVPPPVQPPRNFGESAGIHSNRRRDITGVKQQAPESGVRISPEIAKPSPVLEANDEFTRRQPQFRPLEPRYRPRSRQPLIDFHPVQLTSTDNPVSSGCRDPVQKGEESQGGCLKAPQESTAEKGTPIRSRRQQLGINIPRTTKYKYNYPPNDQYEVGFEHYGHELRAPETVFVRPVNEKDVSREHPKVDSTQSPPQERKAGLTPYLQLRPPGPSVSTVLEMDKQSQSISKVVPKVKPNQSPQELNEGFTPYLQLQPPISSTPTVLEVDDTQSQRFTNEVQPSQSRPQEHDEGLAPYVQVRPPTPSPPLVQEVNETRSQGLSLSSAFLNQERFRPIHPLLQNRAQDIPTIPAHRRVHPTPPALLLPSIPNENPSLESLSFPEIANTIPPQTTTTTTTTAIPRTTRSGFVIIRRRGGGRTRIGQLFNLGQRLGQGEDTTEPTETTNSSLQATDISNIPQFELSEFPFLELGVGTTQEELEMTSRGLPRARMIQRSFKERAPPSRNGAEAAPFSRDQQDFRSQRIEEVQNIRENDDHLQPQEQEIAPSNPTTNNRVSVFPSPATSGGRIPYEDAHYEYYYRLLDSLRS